MALQNLLPPINIRTSAWSLIIVISLIGAIAHFSVIVLFYLNNPKSIDIQIREDAYKFPDVTFCKLHNFNRQKYMNNVYFSAKYNKSITLKEIISRIYTFWTLVQNITRVDSMHMVENTMRRHAYRYDLYEYPWAEILFCRFGGVNCDFNDFYLEKHPNYFLCFTFPGDFQKSNIGGLKIFLANWVRVIFSQTRNIEEEPLGYVISIHPQNMRPRFGENSIYLTDLNINLLNVEYHEFNALDQEERPCVDRFYDNVTYVVDDNEGEFLESRTFRADYDDCVIVKRQEYLYKECGCIDPEMYVPIHMAKATFCQDLPENFYLYDEAFMYNKRRWIIAKDNMFDILRQAYKKDVMRRLYCHRYVNTEIVKNPEIFGKCLPDCHRKFYKVTAQRQSVPNIKGFLDKNFKLHMSDKEDSVTNKQYGSLRPVYLKVYSSSPEANILVETWAYTMKSFLSDIGGVLGLWIGVSFITLFEIGEYMLRNYAMRLEYRDTVRSTEKINYGSTG